MFVGACFCGEEEKERSGEWHGVCVCVCVCVCAKDYGRAMSLRGDCVRVFDCSSVACLWRMSGRGGREGRERREAVHGCRWVSLFVRGGGVGLQPGL